MEEKSWAKRGGTSGWFGVFSCFQHSSWRIMKFLVTCVGFVKYFGIFSSIRTSDRGLLPSSAPVNGMLAMIYITCQICGMVCVATLRGDRSRSNFYLSAVAWACCRMEPMARICSVLGAGNHTWNMNSNQLNDARSLDLPCYRSKVEVLFLAHVAVSILWLRPTSLSNILKPDGGVSESRHDQLHTYVVPIDLHRPWRVIYQQLSCQH